MPVLPTDPGPLLIIHCDGAARGNPGPAGIGVVVQDADGRTVAEIGEGIGVATNNQAEYHAALAGLRVAADRGARRVVLRSDSRLLVEQLAGRFRVKSPTLQRLNEEARRLMRSFDEVRLEHVPRDRNAEADRLANRGVDEWVAAGGAPPPAPQPPPSLLDE